MERRTNLALREQMSKSSHNTIMIIGLLLQQGAVEEITLPEPCPFCGSVRGTYKNDSGWDACIDCEGV